MTKRITTYLNGRKALVNGRKALVNSRKAFVNGRKALVIGRKALVNGRTFSWRCAMPDAVCNPQKRLVRPVET